MTSRTNPRVFLAQLRPERRRRIVGVAATLLLGWAALLVVVEPDRGLGLLLLALGGLFFIMQPHWAVLVIVVVSMFRLSPVRVGPLSTGELLAGGLILPFALELLRDRKIWVWRVPHVRLLLGIAGVLLAATAWSQVMHPAPPVEALDRPWDELFFFSQSLLLLLYLVYFIKTPRHLVYAVSVVVLMILAAATEAVSAGHRRLGTDFFEGFAGNANRLAHLCVWGTALCWSLRYNGPSGWWRRLTLVPVLALPVVTLMTGSRSGLLQLVLLAGLILLEQRQWSPAQRARASALLLTISLVAFVAAPAALVQRASNLDVGGRTTVDRLRAIEASVIMVAENPVFGVGPRNFQWRYQLLTGHAMSTHNSYLWAVLSGGPLLLVLYLVLFYRTYRTLRTVERIGPPPFLWLATALRLNLVMFLVFSFFATVWTSEVLCLLVALTIILVRITSASAARIATMPPAAPVPAR
jgi:O-antigen ligase